MEPFEVVVEGELFRVSERMQPDGALSYDFAWLNGPGEGTYGFTLGRSFGWTFEEMPDAEAHPAERSTPDELIAAARGFVESFYERGGIGQTDFPDHAPANAEPDGRE